MDIYKAIEELRAEKGRLDRAIAALEEDSAASARQSGERGMPTPGRRPPNE